jgi:cytidylate kinase
VIESAPVVAIDGPSGSGKGTIARGVARRLRFHLLDSGALYRLTALAIRQQGVDATDHGKVAEAAECLEFCLEGSHGEGRFVLQGQDVSFEIRAEATGKVASEIASQLPLRHALLQRQRAFRRPPGLVADGRDMGSVVFPDAVVKIYLTAAPEERARRRYKQLIEKGMSVSLPALVEDIAERDKRDASRCVSPLRAATDAIVVDTSELSIEEVISEVLDIVRQRLSR